RISGARGRAEIRFSKGFLPFAVFATDLEKRSGAMSIAFHNYRTTVGRPHVMLYADEDAQWYDFFRQQINAAWNDGVAIGEWRKGKGNQA
ncbi:MAG: hypothetical protein KDA37_11970, partial [Planctomycetales bacterium]|nr:hypothetical protein [Planctomycetales bacterium]